MCGRFTLRTPTAQMLEIFNLVEMPALAPRYNIAPTQLVICVRSVVENPKSREAVQMKWGLVPFWAKDIAIGNQMINARAETVAEKPAFRAAFAKRRCLIPADGFLEWQKLSTGKKQPWLMEMAEQQPFAMAGLWEYWTPKGDSTAKPVVSCSIITTSANEDMSVLHDRMPVILPIEAWATWLSPTANATQCKALLKSLENGLLTKTCVSTMVNRPFPDNAECLQPVDPPEPLTKPMTEEG
jgi:putative SOS response-associated peptidase YedK